MSEYDVVVFTETWLRSSVFDSEIFCNSYDVYRRDRPDGYGGVLVAVRSACRSERVLSPLFDDLEFIALKIQLQGKAVYLTCSYIPPRSDEATYVRHCQCILFVYNILGPSDNFIVCGDFNIPNAQWRDSENNWSLETTSVGVNSVLDLSADISLYQINKVRNSINRILDLVFVNDGFTSPVQRVAPMAIPEDMYHPPLSFSVEAHFDISDSIKTRSMYRYKDTDFIRLRDLLAAVNWSELLLHKNTEAAVEIFYEVLWSCLYICVPVATVKCNTSHSLHPWQTPQLRYWRNRKNRLYKKFKQTGVLMHYAQYIESRHRYAECNNNCYFNYLVRVKPEIRLNPKRFFNFVNTWLLCHKVL